MARNTIQVRRSATNSITSLLSGGSLAAGELAYTSNGVLLYIGDANSVGTPIRIGGQMNPGTLTANQALVANSTSAINRIIVANLSISTISANGELGTPGYVLATSGTSGNAYWTSSTGFGVDPFASYVWTNTHTFSNSITFTQTIIGTAYNATKLGGLDAGQYANNDYLTTNFQLKGSALADNVATLTACNSINLGGNPASYYASNTFVNTNYTNTANLPAFILTKTANDTIYVKTGTSTFIHGANVVSNSQLIANLANYTNNAGMSTLVGTLTAQNANYLGGQLPAYYSTKAYADTKTTNSELATHVSTLTSYSADRLNGQLPDYYTTNSALAGYISKLPANNTAFVGVSPASSIVNSTSLSSTLSGYAALSGANFGVNSINAYSYKTGTGYGGLSGPTTTGAIVNTTHIAIGNSSVNGYITANSTNVYFTGVAYNANVAAYIGTIAAADVPDRNEVVGLIYAASYGGATQSYVDTKASAAYTNAYNYASINHSLAIANSVTAYTNALADTLTRNATYTGNNIFNGTTATFNANIVAANASFWNLNVTGNLNISGTLTTINSTELQIKDNSLLLSDSQASTSTYTDAVDIIVYGQFGNTSNTWYSGLYRDSSASQGRTDFNLGVWKLFSAKSGTDINSISNSTVAAMTSTEGDVNYKLGVLTAYLEPYGVSGRFVANATSISITANSTVNVNISANSLVLSSPLAAVSGGTGINVYSVGDMLYAASTTSFTKISVGTPGQILQISDQNLPRYADLDGGSF
jgi:hypothetical protein